MPPWPLIRACTCRPIKEPKFFLTDGPPPDRGGGPGDVQTYREHVWRRTDYEALFADAPPGALRGESTPFYLYDRDAQRRISELIPRRQDDRDPAGPGRAGPLELDPPVVGRAGAGRRLRPRLRRGGRPGRGRVGPVLALHAARPLRRAAGAPVPAVPPGAGVHPALPRAAGHTGAGPRRHLRVPRRAPGHRRPGAEGERHRAAERLADPPGRSPGWRGAPPRSDGTSRARRATRSPGRWSASCSRTRASASRCPGRSARPCCPTSRTTSGSSSGSPAPTSATGCSRGSAPAGWSAPGRPGSRRRATASPATRSSVRSSWAPSGRVIS